MDSGEGAVRGVFTCELCELSSPYTFYGQKPPNTRGIVLLEECYGMRDPFSPEKEKFLVLGSKCCLCNKTVCVSTMYSRELHGMGFHGRAATSKPHVNKLHQMQGRGADTFGNSECSLFYTKRFCLPCVREHLEQFPEQIRTELVKKKPQKT